MKLELYTKPRCSLCEPARATVVEVLAALPFEVELVERDITRSPSLFERFRLDIPVAYVGSTLLFRHRVDAGDLRRKILSLRGT